MTRSTPSRVTDSYGPAHPVVARQRLDHRRPEATSTPPMTRAHHSTPTATRFARAADHRHHRRLRPGRRRRPGQRHHQDRLLGGRARRQQDRLGAAPSHLRTTVGAGTGGTDLVTNTRYNDAGQTVQSWLPGSTGSDARSTSTSYYTATGTGPCVSAALAGLACSTGPTAQPATGHPLPVTTTSYNRYDQPAHRHRDRRRHRPHHHAPATTPPAARPAAPSLSYPPPAERLYPP